MEQKPKPEHSKNLPDLVDVQDFGIKGVNYYLTKMDQFGITPSELTAIGLENNSALVRREIIPDLQTVQAALAEQGYGMIIKDAYRSPELYQLVRQKRYERDGQENTDRTLDAVNMPHTTGYTVDVNLTDLETGQELSLWDKADWPDGALADFYKNRQDSKSQEYQKLQRLLIRAMSQNSFHMGEKGEFWHFVWDGSGK